MLILKIQESAENYLETILMIGKRKSHVRSIDIANELEFSKPSVSVAMKNLRINGYIEVDAEGFITLSGWLIRLGVDPKTAAEDACRMEHVISAESFEAIKKHTHRTITE